MVQGPAVIRIVEYRINERLSLLSYFFDSMAQAVRVAARDGSGSGKKTAPPSEEDFAEICDIFTVCQVKGKPEPFSDVVPHEDRAGCKRETPGQEHLRELF